MITVESMLPSEELARYNPLVAQPAAQHWFGRYFSHLRQVIIHRLRGRV